MEPTTERASSVSELRASRHAASWLSAAARERGRAFRVLAASALVVAVGCGESSGVGDAGATPGSTIDAYMEPGFVDAEAPDAAGDGPDDAGETTSQWTPAAGYAITGGAADRSVVELTHGAGGFGEKPGGGPPLLWDFGTEVYVEGEPITYNAELGDGEAVVDSPLYDRYSGRQAPVFQTTSAHLRFDGSGGHYLAPGGSPDGEKAGAYFLGVAVTGGKTSRPAPFRDGRYYYSFRQTYPEGTDDNSLKTMRGSQRDSQSEGWYGSAAGNINKNGWTCREDGVRTWPPASGGHVPVWSRPPAGDVRRWHLQEMLIDPTGDTRAGSIFNTWYLWFADTGRNEWLPSMHLDSEGNEIGRWAPTECWDDSRGFYHQVGPEPAGYRQPDYYFGEIYVDDSWRRLYLGNAPTWAETSEAELQRPIAWSDERIEFALNLGALRGHEHLYLFWVDNHNTATYAGSLALTAAHE